MAELPSGTVTFLLTDVEGSTALWEEAPEAMRAALSRHDVLFDIAVDQHRGVHIRPRGEGDSRFAVFTSAPDALAAALHLQRAFVAEPWPTPRPVKVRIGIHTGEAQARDGDYYGSAVNRCARIRGLGHGGQTLLSEAVAALVRDSLPSDLRLRDLGEYRLRYLTRPERVFQPIVPDLPTDFPPLESLDERPHNLPTQPTVLIGREREVQAIIDLMLRPEVRLVTLTGPGGTGKTRIGLQVSADLLEKFADGITFVALATINDPALVMPTIAQTIGVSDVGSRPVLEALKEYLSTRRTLLLLDNFEQIVPAAPAVAELLSACPGVSILVTSREALHLRGEHEYPVPPLMLPESGLRLPTPELSQYPAIVLFIQRAAAARPDFVLSEQNAVGVVEVCRRLDGLPLAIELAAARIKLLSPEALLSRLVHRLPLLTGGQRDLPARQRTLRDTIAWSYDLLDADEKALFCQLAVFVGGFNLEEAEEICTLNGTLDADVMNIVASLVDKSLVRHTDTSGSPRFEMFETIREFALERLDATGQSAEMRRRHAFAFLTLAETAEPLLRGADQAHWLERLDAEHDNLRAALDWGLAPDGDIDLALRLSGSLAWFWYSRSHADEGRRWLTQALARGVSPSLAGVKALTGAGRLAHITLDSDTARPLLTEAVRLARMVGDRWWIAWTLHLLGRLAYFDNDAESARSLADESLAVARQIDDAWLTAWALHLLALASHIEGDYATARPLYEESLSIRRRLGFREGIGIINQLLGTLDYFEGDYASALTRYRESMEPGRGLHSRYTLSNLVAYVAALAVRVGQPERGVRLAGALAVLSEQARSRTIPLATSILDAALEEARSVLGETQFEAEQQVGGAMSWDDVIAAMLTIELSSLSSEGAKTSAFARGSQPDS